MDGTLSLNAIEVLVLTDRVLNSDGGEKGQEVTSFLLLEKLGSAYLEMVTAKGMGEGEVPLVFTEAELWLLRSKVTSADRGTESDPLFGIKLLNKLYAAILKTQAPRFLTADEEDDSDKDSVKSRLTRWEAETESRSYEGLP